MPEVVCPIPVGLAHDDAREMFNKVRKEMPELTPAAHRREAARRLNVDYDTFLAAWKKAKTTKPVTPPPVVVPDPPIKVPKLTPKDPAPAPSIPSLTHETARAQHKLVKKERPDLSDAEARREAARRMDVDYDTFLKAWKRERGAPGPAPTIPPQTPTVTPHTTKAVAVKHNVAALKKFLASRNFKMSTKTKERMTHTGKTYGGGISETEGLLVKKSGENIVVSYRPGYASVERVQDEMVRLRKELQDAGLIVDSGFTRTTLIVKPPPVKTFADDKLPWKRKGESTALEGRGEKLSMKVANPIRTDIKLGRRTVGSIIKNYQGRYSPTMHLHNRLWSNQLAKGSFKNSYATQEDALKAAQKFLDELELDDVNAVNPGFQQVKGTTNNCISCTTSYELRRRGFDVQARLMPQGFPVMDIYRAWGATAEAQVFSRAVDYWPSSISQSTWLSKNHLLPDGARGFLTVTWKHGRSGHILNWEMRDGEIWYIDTQPGKEYRGSYPGFSNAEDDIHILRVDELEINPDSIGFMTSDSGQRPISASEAPSYVRLK